MAVYSFSQLKLYDLCPRKFRYQYVDKIPYADELPSPELIIGKAVHAGLAYLYEHRIHQKHPKREEILTFYEQEFDKEWTKKVEVRPGFSKHDYQRRGEAYLLGYYEMFTPFDQGTIVGIEQRIVFALDEKKQLKFRGVIDRLDKQGDFFVINDYKTTKYLPPTDKEDDRDQIVLYAIGVHQHYAKYLKQLHGRVYYLHFGEQDERQISSTQIDQVKQRYAARIKHIENERFAYNMGDTDVFEPKENATCRRCAYYSICPLWTHLGAEKDHEGLRDNTIVKLVDRYAQLAEQIRMHKAEKDSIKQILVAYCTDNDYQRLFGDEYQLSLSRQEYVKLKNTERVEQILSDKKVLSRYVSLDRFALRRALQDGDLDRHLFGDALMITTAHKLRERKRNA